MGLTAEEQTSHPGVSVSEADAGSAIFRALVWKGTMLTLLRAADSCVGDDVGIHLAATRWRS